MKKSFAIFLLSLFIHQAPVLGQKISDDNNHHADSVLLITECKLEPKQVGWIFTGLEIIAGFPGGSAKWFEFFNKNFNFNFISQNMGDTVQQFRDSIVVKFVVTRDGKVCHVIMQKGNSILEEPVKRLLAISPDWEPGLNGNRLLNSYRTLRIDIYINKAKGISRIERYINSYYRLNDR
ncbi:MAG: hypothetical protein ABI480_11080 [Chitinophagaceae bacterium]